MAGSTPESSFRQQLNSWTSRPAFSSSPAPRQSVQLSDFSLSSISNTISSINPFKSGNGGGYMQLPISENDTSTNHIQEPSWFNMSRWDRIVCFGVCLVASIIFFVICFALFPVLALRPQKFAILWSLGSLLFVLSFGCLQGPMNYAMHLISLNRLPFTLAYFGSIVLTLFFSLGLRNALLTILACLVQIVAAIWYTVSYFPMGTQGMRVAGRFGARRVNAWLDS